MIIGQLNLDTLVLGDGEHEHDGAAWDDNGCYTGEVCLMEACSMAACSAEIGDSPTCTNPTLSRIGIALNDAEWPSDKERTETLAPLIPLLIHTSGWDNVGVRIVLNAMVDALSANSAWKRPAYWDESSPTNRLADLLRDGIHVTVDDLVFAERSAEALVLLQKLTVAFAEALKQ